MEANVATELEKLNLTEPEVDVNISEPPPHASSEEGTENIRFNPPIYLQRYGMVQTVLKELFDNPDNRDVVNGQTVMEVGCAEFGMHIFFKGNMKIGKIIYVDIDEQLLLDRKFILKPLPAEYLQKPMRPKPLMVEVYAGDITTVDTRLVEENPRIWCVVAIELIEHLHLPDLRGFEISVFGVIKPEIVIVTTPNADFNPIFNLPPGKFRHWDHKWEWTRDEFNLWCQNLCQEFPEYTFSVNGIGEGPPETAALGCVSQMAVFKKSQPSALTTNSMAKVKENAYKLLESIVYPNYVEIRTVDEIIISDVDYLITHIWLSKRNIEYCMENNISEFIFTLTEVIEMLPSKIPGDEKLTLDHFRKILLGASKYTVNVHNDEYSIRIAVPLWDQNPSSDLEDDMDMEDDNLNGPRIVNLPHLHDSSVSSSTDCDESWD